MFATCFNHSLIYIKGRNSLPVKMARIKNFEITFIQIRISFLFTKNCYYFRCILTEINKIQYKKYITIIVEVLFLTILTTYAMLEYGMQLMLFG